MFINSIAEIISEYSESQSRVEELTTEVKELRSKLTKLLDQINKGIEATETASMSYWKQWKKSEEKDEQLHEDWMSNEKANGYLKSLIDDDSDYIDAMHNIWVKG